MEKLISSFYKNSNETYILLLNKYLYKYNANLVTYKYLNQIFVNSNDISSIIDDDEIELYAASIENRYDVVKSWDKVERWAIFDFGFKINELKTDMDKINIFTYFHIVFNMIMILKCPKISKIDTIDLNTLCNNLSREEQILIGQNLIKNGNKWRKDRKGQWTTLKIGDNKEVKFYIPKDKDKSVNILTISKLATITAWNTAEYLVSIKENSYLALSIGWDCIYDDNIFKKITDIDSTITREILILPSIPKVKPHKYLNLTQAMADIFVVFHAINDVFMFRNRYKFSFLTDIMRKLFSIGISANMNNVSKYIKVIAPACFHSKESLFTLHRLIDSLRELDEYHYIGNSYKDICKNL